MNTVCGFLSSAENTDLLLHEIAVVDGVVFSVPFCLEKVFLKRIAFRDGLCSVVSGTV